VWFVVKILLSPLRLDEKLFFQIFTNNEKSSNSKFGIVRGRKSSFFFLGILCVFSSSARSLLVQSTDKLQKNIKPQVRIRGKNPYLLQSSILSPFTLEKCFTLFDTNVAFAASADAAMSISMLSSGFPDFSSVARISP